MGERFSISTGLGLFTYPNAGESEYKFIAEPVVSFGYEVSSLVFSANIYYDLMQKGPTFEFGIDYSIPMVADRCNLELSALIGRCDWSDLEKGADEKIGLSGDYYQAGIAIPFEFSKHAKLTVGYYYEKGKNFYAKEAGNKVGNPFSEGHGVFHAGFSYIF
jgi:hypothetical protein